MKTLNLSQINLVSGGVGAGLLAAAITGAVPGVIYVGLMASSDIQDMTLSRLGEYSLILGKFVGGGAIMGAVVGAAIDRLMGI